jgi:hypothetical protein
MPDADGFDFTIVLTQRFTQEDQADVKRKSYRNPAAR